MQTTFRQRLGGLFLVALGLGFTIYEWSSAASTGEYHPKTAFLFPFGAGLGLMLLLFPINKTELLTKYGVERPRKLAHYSWGQRILILLAVVAGGINLALISGTVRF